MGVLGFNADKAYPGKLIHHIIYPFGACPSGPFLALPSASLSMGLSFPPQDWGAGGVEKKPLAPPHGGGGGGSIFSAEGGTAGQSRSRKYDETTTAFFREPAKKKIHP